MTEQHPNQKTADEQATGLRALANALEANPELAQFVRIGLGHIGTHVFDSEREKFATFVRAFKAGGAEITKDYHDKYAMVKATFGPVVVVIQADREEVCERVVVGTETVTKTVKDPAVLATVPDVEITEQVEIVEWQCKPLLAAEQVTA